MAISFTYHGESVARQADGSGQTALSAPMAARVDVADAGASGALTQDGWYRIAASTTSYVAFGAAVTNGTNGMHIPAGTVEIVHLKAGIKIGCSAGV